jgi:hypothetical protein
MAITDPFKCVLSLYGVLSEYGNCLIYNTDDPTFRIGKF